MSSLWARAEPLLAWMKMPARLLECLLVIIGAAAGLFRPEASKSRDELNNRQPRPPNARCALASPPLIGVVVSAGTAQTPACEGITMDDTNEARPEVSEQPQPPEDASPG